MDTLASRLKQARLAAKLSQGQLARLVGVSQGLIGQIESHKNQGSRHITALARAVNVSPDWLETGKGPRQRDTAAGDYPPAPGALTLVETAPGENESEDEYAWLPRLVVELSPRDKKVVWYIDKKGPKQAFNRDWCQSLGVNPINAATLIHRGPSMEPRLNDRDTLLVDHRNTEIVDGKVYVLSYQNELFVKRIFKKIGGGIVVRSDSQDKMRYPDAVVFPDDMEHIEIIARVVGVCGAV
ncbi:phage repressor protein [Burkholderia sp. Nafp2/4-1b]|uniref:XRE family transcriptional regulator n=1 Tax=Burkholderia sp. Nafp2/4-1b TaxID=2116686 RepID=UPI000EF91C39|nr:S24 family peptidase [Burkholderia sp. Nafp2/4-1b]RKU03377.1 phage repressor protein [Burkholderia sp. Nafp2/4-1b]